MANQDLGDFADSYHAALDKFFGGDPEPVKQL
jgi:hypothetical protein